MSNPHHLAEDQLLELLLQLKKTTPESARAILNSQPQIAYALITLMVNINAVNIDVLQKTVASFGAAQAQQLQQQPVSALPPYLHAQYRTSTPPTLPTPPSVSQAYPYSNGNSQPQPLPQPPLSAHVPPPVLAPGNYSHNHTAPPSSSHSYPSSSYTTPQPGTSNHGASPLPEALAAIPDDQKAIIMRVLSMTPEQINQLPVAERSNVIQLRTTLGLAST